MRGLARNGTAKPISRGQILRRERGQKIKKHLVQLTTSKIASQPTYSAESAEQTYMQKLIYTLPRLPPGRGEPELWK